MKHTPTIEKILLIGLLALLISLSQPLTVSAGTNVWTSHGPEGGPIIALAIDPATPTTLYAVTYVSGVFKSNDAGGTWNAATPA